MDLNTNWGTVYAVPSKGAVASKESREGGLPGLEFIGVLVALALVVGVIVGGWASRPASSERGTSWFDARPAMTDMEVERQSAGVVPDGSYIKCPSGTITFSIEIDNEGNLITGQKR